MRTEHPTPDRIGALRKLWHIAFGDSEDFLDSFFGTAFACHRCLCIPEGETIAAALYWMDCSHAGQKLAYIYAVATHPDFRGRGLCKTLMTHTHQLLAKNGYQGVLLVPQDAGLRRMYGKMGYRDVGGQERISCEAGTDTLPIRAIGAVEFASLRRCLLPAGGVLQEGEGLDFLAGQLQFYTGDRFLLAAYAQGETLYGMELLGNADAAPGILNALGLSRGVFRVPGQTPFAMFLPLSGTAVPPTYFGFAFD